MAKLKWLSARLPEPEYLSTPSFGVNRALGGRGIREGGIHTIWGAKTSGKSTWCLYLIAQAQREGKVCAYVDAEKTFSSSWAQKCGVDVDALLLARANSAEDLLDLIIPDLASGKIDLLIFDSIQSTNFDSFFDKPASSGGMGSYARSSKLVTHKILNALQPNQHVVFISHAAMDLSGTYPVLKAAIGNSIEHWSSTIIKLTKKMGKDSIRESDKAHTVKWKIEKSKQSEYPIEGEFYFTSSTAQIDVIDEIVTAAIDEGLISGGGWPTYRKGEDDARQWRSKAALVEALKGEEADFLEQLKKELNEIAVHAQEDEE
jgi:recombination protein RecA